MTDLDRLLASALPRQTVQWSCSARARNVLAGFLILAGQPGTPEALALEGREILTDNEIDDRFLEGRGQHGDVARVLCLYDNQLHELSPSSVAEYLTVRAHAVGAPAKLRYAPTMRR